MYSEAPDLKHISSGVDFVKSLVNFFSWFRTHFGICAMLPFPFDRETSKRLIWVEGDDFTAWCCSHCIWGMTASRLESTTAALAFNRLAQETFEKHNCADSTH